MGVFLIAYTLLLSFFMVCKGLVVSCNSRVLIRRSMHSLNSKHRAGRRAYLRMKVRIGIVGIPNVGKSSLFNALAQKSIAQAENFPFCTIDPNVAPIAIPDEYLTRLGAFADSKRAVPATMDWVDVAGLARGASRGEGLGNRFLATVRECDAICHVVRNFEAGDIVHVDGRVDPVADVEAVNLELLLADLAHVERRLEKGSCMGDERAVLDTVAEGLQNGVPARSVGLSDKEVFVIKSMGLLTLKPVLYALNVDEIDFTFGRNEAIAGAEQILKSVQYCDPSKDMFTLISAKLEAELSEKSKNEQLEYFTSLGMDMAPGKELDDLLSYSVLPLMATKLLGLSLAYTGPGVPPERSRTTRAHLFRRQSLTADDLAGRIHGDIQRGFIRAEVAHAIELLRHRSYAAAKEEGCIRTEGREYLVHSEDVVLIKWK